MSKLTFAQTLERLGRDDVLAYVTLFVTGLLFRDELRMKRFPGFDSHGWDAWVANGVDKVWRYLNGKVQIDASFHDTYADAAFRAAKAFGWPEYKAPVAKPITLPTQPVYRCPVSGLTDEEMRSMSQTDFNEYVFRVLFDHVNKVAAIKMVRVRAGIGLYEAKAMTEIIMHGTTDMSLEEGVRSQARQTHFEYQAWIINERWDSGSRRLGYREGWILVEASDHIEIQKIDDPEDSMFGGNVTELTSDDDAIRIVARGTMSHHVLARKILESTCSPNLVRLHGWAQP